MSIDDNWVVNPFFRFDRMHLDGVQCIHARILRRGLGWRDVTFSKDEKPRLYSLFDEMLEVGREAESDLNLDLSDDDVLALSEFGFLLPADEVAQAVRLIVPLPCESDTAAVEPRTTPSLNNEPPLGIELPAEHVAPGLVVWMADDDSNSRFPYWPSTQATHTKNSGASLTTNDVRAPREALEARRAQRNETLSHVAAKVNSAGYAILPSLLPRAQQLALRAYFRALIAEGHVQFGDGQVDRRFGQHNEPVARLYLSLLTNVISAATNIAIKPAYAYLASYREGAVLERHRDRPQCALSVSLLIDYEPNDDDTPSPWPLWVAHPNDPLGVTVYQRVGDGIVYKGCELDHWRSALPPGHRSTHLFLHYVPIDFTGDLD